jgi:cellulose synthase/poly-beta-1,6-N-acetylglucosamine synthase-like glycosyltransferase
LHWNTWIRQIHRWLSIAFTAGFVVNGVVIFGLRLSHPPFWVYLLALIPLFLLLPTGLYLFALPYAARWGRSRPRPQT